MRLGLVIGAAAIGMLFIGHGTQKLPGWFGGYRPEYGGELFESTGLRPGRRNALPAGLSATGGAALLAPGLLTLLAGAMIVTITAAIRTAHFKNSPWPPTATRR